VFPRDGRVQRRSTAGSNTGGIHVTDRISQAPHAQADEPFVLPMPGLFADATVGCGHFQLPDDFRSIEPKLQLAILAGWLKGIEQEKTRSLVQCFQTRFPGASETLPERLREFEAYCRSQAIEVPPDFVIALQQH
jgi:hypothetical protein